MALRTAGTTTTTVLSAFLVGTDDASSVTPSLVGALNLLILDDQNVSHPIWPTAYAQVGTLMIPNRGVLKCLPGDLIAVDPATGWPILISKGAAAGGGDWDHT
jgi:hypothetical protein